MILFEITQSESDVKVTDYTMWLLYRWRLYETEGDRRHASIINDLGTSWLKEGRVIISLYKNRPLRPAKLSKIKDL